MIPSSACTQVLTLRHTGQTESHFLGYDYRCPAPRHLCARHRMEEETSLLDRRLSFELIAPSAIWHR
jgi:hypothetical protein